MQFVGGYRHVVQPTGQRFGRCGQPQHPFFCLTPCRVVSALLVRSQQIVDVFASCQHHGRVNLELHRAGVADDEHDADDLGAAGAAA
ncbi:hypothetical protein D3C80_833770 [compost metagenome]